MEMLISMTVIAILMAVSAPMLTQFSTAKTGVDRNVSMCINNNTVSNGDGTDWYTASTGNTSIPIIEPCRAAVSDVQYNRGKAYNTAAWFAGIHGTADQQSMAKKILRAACDQGGEKACDYFINHCWKDGNTSAPYCDDTSDFSDITYYLHQNPDLNTNYGATYIYNQLESLLPKLIPNLIQEVLYSCDNDQAPDNNQNIGSNIACELTKPWLYIKSCSLGYLDACTIAHDNNYNKSCTQIKTNWSTAPTGDYNLTYKYDGTASSLVPVTCKMYNIASAAVSGCNAIDPATENTYNCSTSPITDATNCSDDCYYAYNRQYNRSCSQVFASWPYITEGNYNLTVNGAPNPAVPVTTFCNGVDPNCDATGNEGHMCPDGSIYAGEYNGIKLYTTPSDENGPSDIHTYPWNNGLGLPDLITYEGFDTLIWSSTSGKKNQFGLNKMNYYGNGTYVTLIMQSAPYKAAQACQNSTQVPTHTDWFLPSIEELAVLYTNRNKGALSGTFNTSIYYWSSTGTSASSSARLNFATSYTGGADRDTFYRVRCIRTNDSTAYPDIILKTRHSGDCSVPESQPVGTKCTDAAHLNQLYAGRYLTYNYFIKETDETGVMPWNNGTTNYITTGATSTTNGLSNTTMLKNSTDIGSPYYAALACNDLNSGSGTLGKTDWFLPSLYELRYVLMQNVADIGTFLTGNDYHSSTEVDDDEAYFSTSNNTNYKELKYYNKSVRCIRKD